MEDNNTKQKDARRHQILERGNGWLSGFINKMNQEKQPPMETSISVHQSMDKPIQPLQRMFSLGDTTTKPTTTTPSTSKSKSDTIPQQRRLSIPTSICHTDAVIDGEDAMSRDDEDQSVLSEVTLMTYSDEKANMIKEEFYNRMRLQTRELSMEEKQTLLRKVQDDQEEKFKLMDLMQKKRQQKEKEHTREKSDERMRRISKQHLSKKDEELQSSFTSTKTTKHRNSIETEPKDHQVENNTDEVHSIRHGIDDVIELKILVANQQETIDTLSTKLHNLDVLSKRTVQEEQARIRQLEDEKLALIKQLHECKEIGDSKNQELQAENIELKRQIEQLRLRGDRLKESNSTMQTALTDASWRSSRSTRSSSDAQL